MALTWNTLLSGKSKATILSEILAALKALATPFPVDDWSPGAVVRVVLETGFSGALAKVWETIPILTKSIALRLAQQLAEENMKEWEQNAQGSWLYLLATQLFAVTPKPPDFTEGWVRYTNASAGIRTVTAAHVVATTTGLRYQPIADSLGAPLGAGKAILPGTSEFIKVRAEGTGNKYNMQQGTITVLTSTLAGVTVNNEPFGAATSWITLHGSNRESPKEVADRCAARWGRITKLQSVPADGYKSAALDAHADVKKVAVWSNYSHAILGFKANAVTLYLGSDNGAVAAAVATSVLNSLKPYIGLHDALEVQPCLEETWVLTGTIYYRDASLEVQVKAAVEAAILAYEKSLDIGQTGRAWKIRDAVGVSGVTDFIETPTLTDFTPAKRSLVKISKTSLLYAVKVN